MILGRSTVYAQKCHDCRMYNFNVGMLAKLKGMICTYRNVYKMYIKCIPIGELMFTRHTNGFLPYIW